MKIAFVGKGGSGKSTVATLFAQYAISHFKEVIAIDADINQHFGTLLGIEDALLKKLPSIGKELPSIRTYVQGENSRIQSPAHFRMTTPPAKGSKVVHAHHEDPLLSRYLTEKNGVYFCTTGEFEHKDVGMICYHGKTMATEIILNHLADTKDECVIVDMTAGADAFSTGIFLKFDLIVLVVEPTAQSMSVYHQYKEYSKEYGLNLMVVGNKVDEPIDEEFIKNSARENYLGSVPFSKEIRNLERQKPLSPEFYKEIEPILNTIVKKLSTIEKNWEKFYNDLVMLHRKHAKSWLNKAFQTNFEDQIDKDFDPVHFYGR